MKKILLTTLLACTSAYIQADSLGMLDTWSEFPTTETARAQSYAPSIVAKTITLDSFNVQIAKNSSADKNQPLKIGAQRSVTPTQSTAGTLAALQWNTMPNGNQRAAISIVSPQAQAIRAALWVQKIPTSATVRFYAQNPNLGNSVEEVSAHTLLATINANISADGDNAQARYFWSPLFNGDEVTIEIELPKDVSASELDIRIPDISHLYQDPLSAKNQARDLGLAAYCTVDVSCSLGTDAQLDAQSRATAQMIFNSQGGTYVCTGTLLNNAKQDKTPYFLTAHHCISSQTEASSLITNWFMRSQSCNSSTRHSSYTRLTGGATLLYATAATDTSFLRLNNPAPSNVAFAGWSSDRAKLALNNSVKETQHPKGDWQKISEGKIVTYANCVDTDPGSKRCTESPLASAAYLAISWSKGISEPGSSGSGLFQNGELVGQLYGGSSSCQDPTSIDIFGLFAIPYESHLHQWLSASNTVSNPTGLWYDPALDGMGFNFIKAPNGLFIYYYGYSTKGERLWLVSALGPTTIPKGQAFNLALQEGTPGNGASFNQKPNNPPGVSAWGSMTVTLNSCSAGQITLTGKDGTQTFNIQKLGNIDGLTCSD